MRRFAILKFNNMKSYKIPVIWSVTATMEIEAESLEDAILKAGKPTAPGRNFQLATLNRLSTMPDYLDGSFEVDMAAGTCDRTTWLPPRRAILLRS